MTQTLLNVMIPKTLHTQFKKKCSQISMSYALSQAIEKLINKSIPLPKKPSSAERSPIIIIKNLYNFIIPTTQHTLFKELCAGDSDMTYVVNILIEKMVNGEIPIPRKGEKEND